MTDTGNGTHPQARPETTAGTYGAAGQPGDDAEVVPPQWPSWPGVARPAAWFLQPQEPATGHGDEDAVPDAETYDAVTYEADTYEDRWFVAGEEEPDWYEEEPPVADSSAAVQGRPGWPGFRVPPGTVPGLSDQRSPWEQAQEVWEDSGVIWESSAEEFRDEAAAVEYPEYPDPAAQAPDSWNQRPPRWPDTSGWQQPGGYRVPPGFGGAAGDPAWPDRGASQPPQPARSGWPGPLSAPTMADALPQFTDARDLADAPDVSDPRYFADEPRYADTPHYADEPYVAEESYSSEDPYYTDEPEFTEEPYFADDPIVAPTMADAPPDVADAPRPRTAPNHQPPPQPFPPRQDRPRQAPPRREWPQRPAPAQPPRQERPNYAPPPLPYRNDQYRNDQYRNDQQGNQETWQAQRLRYPDLPPSRVKRVARRRRRPTPLTVAKVGVPVVVIVGVGAVAVMMLTGRTNMMYAQRGDNTTTEQPSTGAPRATAGASMNMTAFPLYPGRKASAPELVERISTDGENQIAVGSANGLPAIWARPVNGTWSLVTAPENRQGTQALTSVAHGPDGWVAVGDPISGAKPHPVVLVSANGRDWQVVDNEHAFSYPNEFAYGAAAGPAGYIVVGKILYQGRTIAADWWSTDLRHWVRGGNGGLDGLHASSQMLAAAATPGGFVAVGQHGGKPAAWMAGTAHDWMLMDLPMPSGASSAMLTKVVASGNRLVALGQADTASGTTPFAALSENGGASWQLVPITTPGGRAATVTAVTATATGFIAAGQSGQSAFYWTSANGSAWSAPASAPITSITGLSSAGMTVTGVGTMDGRPATVAIPVK